MLGLKLNHVSKRGHWCRRGDKQLHVTVYCSDLSEKHNTSIYESTSLLRFRPHLQQKFKTECREISRNHWRNKSSGQRSIQKYNNQTDFGRRPSAFRCKGICVHSGGACTENTELSWCQLCHLSSDCVLSLRQWRQSWHQNISLVNTRQTLEWSFISYRPIYSAIISVYDRPFAGYIRQQWRQLGHEWLW